MRKRLLATLIIVAAMAISLNLAGCGGGGGNSVSGTGTTTSSTGSTLADAIAQTNFAGNGGEETTLLHDQVNGTLIASLADDTAVNNSSVAALSYLSGASYATYTVCLGCHSANYNTFVKTKHALTWSANSSKFTSAVCLNCHTLDGPFRDTNKNGVQDADETITAFGKTKGAYTKAADVTAEYQAVQCENCHGPASLHITAGDTSKIVGPKYAAKASTCSFCHTAQYEDWSQSVHAKAFYQNPAYPLNSSGSCDVAGGNALEMHEMAACGALSAKNGSGGCGACHTGDGFIKMTTFAAANPTLPNTEAQSFCSTGYAGVTTSPLKSTALTSFCDKNNFGNVGITCAACHDVHGSSNPYQLRAPKEEICTKCHSDRYREYQQTLTATDYQTVNGVLTTYVKNDVVTKWEKTPGGGRGPHAGGMAQIVSGQKGAIKPVLGTLSTTYRYSYSTSNASATVNWDFIVGEPSMPATCVDCHMYTGEADAHESSTTGYSSLKTTGHSFKPRPQACLKCHSSLNVKATVEGIQSRWEARFEELEEKLVAYLKSVGGGETTRSKCSEGPKNADGKYYCTNAIPTTSLTTATALANRDYAAIAEYNIRILEIDQSKGVHNEPYSLEIYEVTEGILKDLGF